jgi:hypothetical protein
MNRIITAGFILGAFGIVVKVLDDLMPDPNKEKFNNFFKRTAEKLKRVRPVQFAQLLDSRTGIAVLVTPLIAAIVLYTINIGGSFGRDLLKDWTWSVGHVGDALFRAVVSLYALIWMLRWLVKFWISRLRAMLREPELKPFLIEFSKVLGLFLLCAIGLVASLRILIRLYSDHAQAWLQFVVVAPLFVFSFGAVLLAAPTLSGVLAFAAWALAVAGYRLLLVVRSVIVWIALHQKGPWHVIVCTFTAICAFLLLFAKP